MGSSQPATQRYRDAFAHRDLVHELEALIGRAWPALTVLDVDGWRLRSARGFTRLVNSVWPYHSRDGLALSERIDRVERVYTQRGQQTCFWLSPSANPRGLDRALAQRGYEATSPVEVRTSRLDHLAALAAEDARRTVLLSEPGPQWLDAWARLAEASGEDSETAALLLRRVHAEQAFAVLGDGDGRDGGSDGHVAVARGVLHGGWLGIDYLAAGGDAHLESAGHALVGVLARWAASRGGERAYCQLASADSTGRALTRGMRFQRAYTYRFRVHPLPPPQRSAGERPSPARAPRTGWRRRRR